MNSVDIVILIIAGIFCIRGLIKGIVVEVFSLAGMILAYFVALREMSTLSDFVLQYIKLPEFLISTICFSLIFIVVFFVLRLMANLISKLIRGTLIGWVDRLGGGVLGLAKGVLLSSLLLLFMSMIPLPEDIHAVQVNSKLDKSVRPVAPAVFNFLVKAFPKSKDFYAEMKEGFKKQTDEMKEQMMQKQIHSLKDNLIENLNLDSLTEEDLEKVKKELQKSAK